MAKPTTNADAPDPGALQDSLEELLIRAEDMGYHYASEHKSHYRSWATVDLLYRLIATLSATEAPEEQTNGPTT